MAKMIPAVLSPDIKSNAEKHIFEWFRSARGTDDWIVLHSLGISTHRHVIHGETDFLVLAPRLGIFALEVKGGRVRRKLGKWEYINRYGNIEKKVRGPFDQAWEGIYSILDSVKAKIDYAHWHLKKIIFGIGVMFPDIEYTSVGVDEEPWQIFDINDGKNVRQYIERIADGAVRTLERLHIPVTEDMYPSTEDVQYLASLLRGDFDQDVPLKIKQNYAEEGFLSLTNEQALCIEQLADNQRSLIRGTAGTGKTMLAIEAVKNAVLAGEKVAFICYNRLLGEWLSKYFSEVQEEQRPAFVGTFHGFMLRLLRSRNIETDTRISGNARSEYYDTILPAQVLQSLKTTPLAFDRLVIDEAQDLIKDSYLEVMEKILFQGLSRGNWMMFGDFSMQSIYASGMTEMDYLGVLQDRAFFTLFRLTRNCRNTKKICIEIENITGLPENAAFEDLVDTPAVDHIVYKDMSDQ